MTYLLIVISIYCLVTLYYFCKFNCQRNKDDQEDTAQECLIVALAWPLVEILLGIFAVVEFYYGQKYKYELWRWRVRQKKRNQ